MTVTAELSASQAGLPRPNGGHIEGCQPRLPWLTGDRALAPAGSVHIIDGEDEAVKQLVLTAKRHPGAWDHIVSRLRQDRRAAAAFAATVQRLTDAGVTVIEHPTRGQGPVRLDNLVEGDGNGLDAESHATCPGHAAAVSEYRPEDVTYYCVDPTANGHQGRFAGAVASATVVGGKMTEEAKVARRAVIEILFPTALCARPRLARC